MSSLEEDATKVADERGLHLVESRPRLLQIDLDSEGAVEAFYQRLKVLEDNGVMPKFLAVPHPVLATTSQNGNKHVYLKTQLQLSLLERIGLQSLLGSDPTRELLALCRYCSDKLDEAKRPVLCLFETDEEIERVRNFLMDGTEMPYA